MYIKLRWSLAKYMDHIRFMPFAEKYKYLWTEGWKNVPDFMIGIPLTVATTSYLIYKAYEKGDYFPQKYHSQIVIYRPGDPRIELITKRDRIDP